MGFSNTKSQPSNDLTNKLFSDKKDKADGLFSGPKNRTDKLFSEEKGKIDKLFSGEKDSGDKIFSLEKKTTSADKLFSGGKVNEKNDDIITSPRPVPRPRLKPKDRENHELNSMNEMRDNNITADQLFDSMGKSSKSVSFSDTKFTNDSRKKGAVSVDQTSSGNDRNPTIERTPPKKSPRRGKLLDDKGSKETTSEHKKRPQPPQRHHESAGSESRWANDGNVLYLRDFTGDDVRSREDTARGIKQMFYDGVPGERAKEGRRWETKDHQNHVPGRNSEGYSGNKEEKIHRSSFRKGHGEEGNITDMFEEHVPASNGIVLSDEDTDRMNTHGMQSSGRHVF